MSVVIPTYNAAELIGEQLSALAAQDYEGAFEVLVVDNASTDDLHAAVSRHSDALSDVRIVRAPDRQGVSHARNVGLLAAAGELVAICDADDRVGQGWLSHLVAAASEADMVGGVLDVDVDLNPIHVRRWRDRRSHHSLPRVADLPYAQGCNLAVWRTAALEVSGWDEDLQGGSDDVDFAWRVQQGGGRLVLAPGAVVAYRQRADLRGLAQQMYRYGYMQAPLVRKHRQLVPRTEVSQVVRQVWWIASRSPFALFSTGRLGRWVAVTSSFAGRIVGSVQQRTWAL